MKQKLFTLLLAVAASIGTMFASTKIGDLYYNLDATNQTAEVTYQLQDISDNYKGLTSANIPSSVEYNSVTYSVTSIGNSAFLYTGLTSVTIPNSVTSIGNIAFYGCNGLTSVTIGNSVTSIGNSAFSGCSGLTSVVWNAKNCSNSGNFGSQVTSFTFGDEVEVIPASICAGMTNLTSITIPSSVTSIGNSAFYGCSGLTSPVYNTHVFAYMPTSYSGAYTIPDGIESIAGGAFYGCNGLTSVTIPNSVTSIGYGAFSDCTGLTSVTIEAETPPTLGSDVFYNTNNCPIYVPCGTLDTYKAAWSDYTSLITHSPSSACTYSISTASANPEWGTTVGDTTALYLDVVEISAIPNYGYHFVRWNDYNTSNPRTVTVTRDMTYTATFAKNVYSITKNAEHGSISGNSSAEYLDFVTLTVTPDYGYHFTQWSDGLKDNPRIAQITQDTTFTAEFAPDRVGTCGKDLALVWSYDPTNKVLTIGNAGSFTENMQFGVEAPNEMEELVIGNSVNAIGANAFAGIETLKKVSIGESVKTIGEQAFYNCVNLETIFNYRPTPTNAYSNAFDGVDKFACSLYVLPSSIDMYKAAAVWRDFYYTYAIGAEEATVTTNDVTVEPQDNAATVTWPTNDNAATYTIQITKDGVVFCTLIFNANGQLTGIAFAPSRDGSHHAPAAMMTAKGMQFTVTGLDSGTHYALTLQAKDSQETVLASYSSEFTTTGHNAPQGLEDVSSSLQGGDRGKLIYHEGHIFILRGDKTYTLTGQEVK